MRYITRTTFTASVFDAKWYSQERQLIYFERTSGDATTVVLKQATSSETGDTIATYTLDADGKVTIDVTEYLRVYKPAYLAISHGSNAAIFDNVFSGLINPSQMLIPDFELEHDPQGEILIIPPQRMIEPKINQALFVGFVGEPSDSSQRYVYRRNGTGNGIALYDGEPIILGNASMFTIERRSGASGSYQFELLKRYDVSPIECEERYVFVYWVASTGAGRRHTFMVRKPTTSVLDVYDLLNIENQFTQIKGREESLTLFLDQLSAYDFWYYSDMITSSEVRVSFDGNTFYRAEVTSNSVTIPESDSFDGKLEIDVNWRKYDAVTL